MNQYTNFKNTFSTLRAEVSKHIVGNARLIDFVALSVLTGLSTAAEGESGIGKTRAAEVALKASGLDMGLIILAGDTTASDVTGNMYYDLSEGEYKAKQGPFNVFTAMLLDELNRTSDRVWNALLDILNSKRTVIDGVAYPLDELAVMLATLNPIESEGTRQLPRALRDRLDWSCWVEYPNAAEMAEIAKRNRMDEPVRMVLDHDDIKQARTMFADARKLVGDEVDIEAARLASAFTTEFWEVKASPRTVISMVDGSVALSLASRGEASPSIDDVRAVAYNCLRHTVEPVEYMSTSQKEQAVKDLLLRLGVRDTESRLVAA